MALAIKPLPVPVSPFSMMVVLLLATFSTILNIFCMALPRQEVLAVLVDFPPGVGAEIGILFEAFQKGGVLENRILSQKQDLLQLG